MKIDDETLQSLYAWVDEVPLTRPKKNIARDFSDGVLTAEIINHYHPSIIQLHNYSSTNSTQQKIYNWTTLSRKVLKKLSYPLSKQQIDDIVNCKSGAIESLLVKLQQKIASYNHNIKRQQESFHHSPSKSADIITPETIDCAYDQKIPHANGNFQSSGIQIEVDTEILVEKEKTIQDLRETVQILELKVQKLEQLVRLKDGKIQTLVAKLNSEKQN